MSDDNSDSGAGVYPVQAQAMGNQEERLLQMFSLISVEHQNDILRLLEALTLLSE
ncbi:hypothetical protein HDC30_000912 [Pseudomonas sp. JAI115]|uniref:hypothetical protein n=1 Tax=Pseudomonas sp. JAI115 TaxID=2723061 RepID=UPI001615AFAC|nr:hypothetical protein [Pseudomonas sp. JAI115]MBB6153718.1 hypothetical protein [Pseudomonas sp. JAI115]